MSDVWFVRRWGSGREREERKGKHTPRRTEPRRIHGRSLLSAGLSYTAYLGCATGCTTVVVVAGYTDWTRAGEDLIPLMLVAGMELIILCLVVLET